MVAYASSVLRDRNLAEVAVQDTFCIFCAKATDTLQHENPQGWLVRTLQNVMRNMQRHRAARADFQLLKRVVLDGRTMLEATEEYGITVEACNKRIQRIQAYLKRKFSDS